MSKNPMVVFVAPKKVVIEDRPMPAAGPAQVLVKSERTLISTGTELTILKSEFAARSAWADYGRLPFVPGYDNVAKVLEVGPGVDKGLVGKRVASFAPHSAFAAVPVAETWVIPEKVTSDEAVFFTIAQIVFNGVRRGQAAWGETAIVYGLGLLGQITVRALLFAGVRPVFAVDVADKRLALLPKHEGLVALNPKKSSVRETVSKHTRGRMADVVYEVTGAPSLIPQEFEALKPLGRFVVLSSPSGKTEFDFHDLCNAPSFVIIGAHNASHPEHETPYNQWTKSRDAELYFGLVAKREIEVDSLVSHREPYTKAPELYAALLADRSQAMGVVLEWDVEGRV